MLRGAAKTQPGFLYAVFLYVISRNHLYAEAAAIFHYLQGLGGNNTSNILSNTCRKCWQYSISILAGIQINLFAILTRAEWSNKREFPEFPQSTERKWEIPWNFHWKLRGHLMYICGNEVVEI